MPALGNCKIEASGAGIEHWEARVERRRSRYEMSHATAENLESAARMAMAPPYEEGRSRVTSSRWYALYAAAMAILLVGAAAVVSV